MCRHYIYVEAAWIISTAPNIANATKLFKQVKKHLISKIKEDVQPAELLAATREAAIVTNKLVTWLSKRASLQTVVKCKYFCKLDVQIIMREDSGCYIPRRCLCSSAIRKTSSTIPYGENTCQQRSTYNSKLLHWLKSGTDSTVSYFDSIYRSRIKLPFHTIFIEVMKWALTNRRT